MIRKSMLCLAILGILFVLSAPAAEASQYWPQVNRNYFCYWSLPHVSGQANVTFTSLNGNDYYRWGYMTTVYPDSTRREVRVVITKPELQGTFTEYEYTTNTNIQCTFRVHSYGWLEWLDCNNGASQVCF